jgi:type 1 glutamine amidotransferase
MKSTTTRGHDVATSSMNVGSRLRALQAFTPRITLANPGDYTETGFNAYCRIDSAGTAIYDEMVAVDSVPAMGSRSLPFPDWNVGPESTEYTVTMWHNCGPDQNRNNDTLSRTTMATASILRVAIEIASGSSGRTPPNACYAIDSLCDAQDWEDSIVTGTDIDTPGELANFDVVVSGDVGYNDNDFATYDDALLSWVRDGGGFVGLGWIVYGIYRSPQPYSPMDSVMPVMASGDYGFLTTGTVTITDSTHPITQGVSDFNIYSHGEWANAGLWSGAVALGSYSNSPSNASIAYRMVGAGRSVYLGPIYFANFGGYNNEPYYQDANAMRLLKQAIEWAAWGSSSGIETPVTPAVPTRLEVARPNPARGLPTVAFALGQSGRVDLAVFDLTGRHVRTLASGQMPAGQHSLNWNRLDDNGRRVSAGVYVVRLEAGDRQLTSKIVLR